MKEKSMGEIVLYKVKGRTEVEVKFEGETVWLNEQQMAELFERERSVISKHIKSVFSAGELDDKSNVHFLHIPKSDKPVKYYNLDMIIAVGYRVNSAKATQFRIWATKVLKDYLIKGYALNQKRLGETKLDDLDQMVRLIRKTIAQSELSYKELTGLLEVATRYTHSRILLQRYDEGSLEIPILEHNEVVQITYQEVMKAIDDMRTNFLFQSYVSELFGIERDCGFKGVLELVYQKFEGQELYPSVEEKAAHLLFFIIKNHPFADGNKKIGAFLFLRFLARNGRLYHPDGSKKIDDHTLVALTLLVAISDDDQKEILIRLILNFLAE